MKNYTAIIIVFSFLLVGIAGAVVGWKYLENRQAAQSEQQYQQYVQKYKTQEAAAKSQPAGGIKPTPTPTKAQVAQSETASFESDLSALSDDGGKSDFDQLQNDISGL